MRAKLKINSVFANLQHHLEWDGGTPSSVKPVQTSSCSETACGQAGQGRREGGKGSARQCVTRRRPTEDAEMGRATRSLRAVSGVAVVAGLLLTIASPAFANRTYDSRFLEGLHHPSIAIGAADDVFISNGPEFSKYAAYPSHTLLGTGELQALRGQNARLGSLAVDDATGQIFAATENYGCSTLAIFGSSGAYEESWNNLGGSQYCSDVALAIDNSNTYSKGRVYVALTHPFNDIEVYDAKRRPVDLPATASYIDANRLTGTPSGSFGSVGGVTVGLEGNLYVVDLGRNVIDEFDSTGTFIRSFSGVGAPEAFTPQGTVAIDPTNGNVMVDTGEEGVDQLAVDEFDSSGNYVGAITGTGPSESTPFVVLANAGGLAVNSSGYVYVAEGPGENVDIFTPNSTILPKVTYHNVSSPTATSGTLAASVAPSGGAGISECQFEYGEEEGNYGLGSVPCEASTAPPYSAATEVGAKVSSLTTGATYHYRVVVKTASATKYGADQTYTPQLVLGLSTNAVTEITESGATLTASFLGNGEDTSYYFEWGSTAAYGNKTAEADAPDSTTETPLSTALTGLAPYTTYHYRVAATNGSGTSYGEDRYFTTTPGRPSVKESATVVHADGAELEGAINPNGAETSYKFEYVTAEEFERSKWTHAATAMGSEPDIGMSKEAADVKTHLSGFWRMPHLTITVSSPSIRSAKLHPFVPSPRSPSPWGNTDAPCPNASLRQHTGAAQLLDCRAYELVSAPNTAGFDVESNLTAGQTPFAGYPEAKGRVLYGIHDGGIPGTGSPTNRGLDPYLAIRGDEGWSTSYVGIPSMALPLRLPSLQPCLQLTPASALSLSAVPKSARPASLTVPPASPSACLADSSSRE